MPNEYRPLSPAEREALKWDFFSSLHCALPGKVISFDAETQTAEIQPAVKLGSLTYPPLSGVPVFMPVPFEVNPGDACLVVFADIDIDAWLSSGGGGGTAVYSSPQLVGRVRVCGVQNGIKNSSQLAENGKCIVIFHISC